MATYQYQPLKKTDDGDEIRVLRLHPCLPGAPLTGSLIPHLLPFEQPESGNPQPSDHTNGYEAVSYHWGSDSTLPFTLLLTSSPTTPQTSSTPLIPLTPSQHDLLRQFALPHRPRTLWIDGLCIQQSNPAEKEQQIKLMRRIYHSAARVLVYLGAAADDSDLALDMVRHVAAFARYLDESDYPPGRAGWEAACAAGLRLPPPEDQRSWRAWRAFWRRAWFRRVWVVQEFVVARRVAVWCGGREVDWIELKLAAAAEVKCPEVIFAGFTRPWLKWVGVRRPVEEFHEAHEGAVAFYRVFGLRLRWWGWRRSWGFEDDGSVRMTEMYVAANEAVERVPEEERKKVEGDWMDSVGKQGDQEFWGWKEESTLPDIIRFRSAEKIFAQDSIWDFEILLLHTRNFKATNPVDRIYGILGLADDIGEDEDDFAPSYGKDQTLKVVMRRFAAGLIRRGKCPAVLAFAGIHDGNEKAPNAWLLRVIDWVHSQQYDLASWFSAPGTRRTPNRTRIPSAKPQPLSWKDELQILPSWVPDWVTVRHSTTTTMQFNLEGMFKHERGAARLYHAALDTTPVVEVNEARDTLRIKGRCFDTLAFVFPDEMTTCPIWYEIIARFVIGTQYPTGEPLVEVIWRTMVANRTFDAERAPASFGDDYAWLQNLDAIRVVICALVPALVAVLGAFLVAYYPLRFRPDNYYTFTAIFIIAQVVTLPPSFQHDWRLVRGIPTVAVWLHWSAIMVLILTVLVRWVYRSRRWLVQHVLVPFGPTTIMINSASLARPTKNWEFCNALALTSAKYSFCLTDKRRLTALVPLSAREGDQLAVFYGCGAPFVIRRHGAFGFYRLIGEAYVHGAMDGGVMRDETCVDEMFALR